MVQGLARECAAGISLGGESLQAGAVHGAEDVKVDRAETEHHRRRLQCLARLEFEKLRARLMQGFDVAGGVDQHRRAQPSPAPTRQQLQVPDAPAFTAHLEQRAMQHGPHTRLQHHLVQDELEHLRRVGHPVHAVAGGHREDLVLTGPAEGTQPVDDLLGQAGHHAAPVGRLPTVELRHRAGRGVASEEAVALDQHDPGSASPRCHGGHRAGHAAAEDGDVGFFQRGHQSAALIPRALITVLQRVPSSRR